MANPDGHIAGMVATIYKQGTSTNVVYNSETSTGSTSRMKDWEFQWEENYPRKIRIVLDNSDQTSTVNVLNAAYAGWSSTQTGAMDIGDEVSLTLISNDTSTSTALVQYAKVIDIETAPDNSVTLIAVDRTQRLESIKKDRVIWKNYRDNLEISTSTMNGMRIFTGIADATIVQPCAYIGYSDTDTSIDLGDGTTGYADITDPSTKVAQAYVQQGNGALGFRITYTLETSSLLDDEFVLDINFELQSDNNNSPSGVVLASGTAFSVNEHIGAYSKEVGDDAVWTTDGTITQVIDGQRYWIVVYISNVTTMPTANHAVKINTKPAGDYPVDVYATTSTPISWSYVADTVLDYIIYMTNFDEYDATQYAVDETSNLIYLFGADRAASYWSGLPSVGKRGRASYYYGTNAMYLIQQALCSLDTGLNYNFPNTFAKTYGTFATRGKPLGDCFRELADQFQDFTETTNVMRQTVFAHYTSTSHYLNGAKRYDITNDTESYVICHGLDTSNDDERIIVGTPDIKKKNSGRYGRVIVAGKADDGTPVFAARSDRAKTGSYWEKTDGCCDTLKVYDENLRTTADCNTEAWRIMDLVNRDVWEGSINLSGNHLLFDFDHTSLFYGSGKILKLTWSPLGIYTTKMKVTKIILRPNNTTVFVNNLDVLTLNKIRNSMKTTEKSEVFLSPLGEPETVYFDIYTTDVPATTGYYMTLVNEDGDELEHLQRVLCTVYNTSTLYSSDTYNMQTFHAEFTPDNGYSVDTSRIRYIELHSAKTGGSYAYQKDLNATVDGAITNEVFDKWKGQRLVVDWNCKAS